jgi:hypothetical protein
MREVLWNMYVAVQSVNVALSERIFCWFSRLCALSKQTNKHCSYVLLEITFILSAVAAHCIHAFRYRDFPGSFGGSDVLCMNDGTEIAK